MIVRVPGNHQKRNVIRVARTYVIAEVGPNHNGSPETADEMVGRHAETGTDAVKFQLALPEKVYSKDAFKADYQTENDGEGAPIEMSRRIQLPADDHRVLERACRGAGVDYLCAAFDMESLRFLDETNDMPFFKFASGEILSVDMLDYMAGRDRKILLSTGMATFDEIGESLAVLERHGSKDITLLHCVSNYPAPHADINLNVIPELKQRYGRPVGYSDHSIGPECCLGAVALGATVIEKHVTLDKNLPGPDHKASATIAEFTGLVAAIRRLEAALGGADKVFSEAEQGIRRMSRKSIVAARDIAAGQVIGRDDICFKRPGTGFSPLEQEGIVGRAAVRDIRADRVIVADDLGD